MSRIQVTREELTPLQLQVVFNQSTSYVAVARNGGDVTLRDLFNAILEADDQALRVAMLDDEGNLYAGGEATIIRRGAPQPPTTNVGEPIEDEDVVVVGSKHHNG